jgi:hypothetical protein
LNIEYRVERLNTFIEEGRIVRHAWLGTDKEGRETACLLAALAPEVAEAEDAGACPASVMPEWFAELTPWIDDEASEAEWPRMVRRYAACAARWSSLDDAAWRRVEIASRRAAVTEAMQHTTSEKSLDACRGVLVWLDEDMPESSRAAAMEAAGAAGAGAAFAAMSAARAAAWAAAMEAAGAAAFAAMSAADVTTYAAAADRITDAVLTALEKECGL